MENNSMPSKVQQIPLEIAAQEDMTGQIFKELEMLEDRLVSVVVGKVAEKELAQDIPMRVPLAMQLAEHNKQLMDLKHRIESIRLRLEI